MKLSTEFLGETAQIRQIRQRLADLAPAKIPVLLTGETGTGKEVLARTIHNLSHRAGPFVVVDCGALSPNLMEEELFGHERGAYTGAAGPRLGLLQEADRGTVFLDEVGEIPSELQTRLLRAIDRGTVRRIGSNRHSQIDVRFISATNRNLLHDVVKGRFRRDLFFRLAGFALSIPPLRERVADIPLLLGHFLSGVRAREISDSALQCLKTYEWPGNIRELELFAERVRVLLKDTVIHEADVRELLLMGTFCESSQQRFPRASLIPAESVRLRDVREAMIKNALLRTRGNVAKAAELLGIGRSTVYAWLGDGRHRRNNDRPEE